jgi:outer membrane protein TolC
LAFSFAQRDIMSSPSSVAFLSVLAASLTLAGCAVKPEPLTFAQLQTISDKNLSRVTANQEPLAGPVTLYQAMARALKYNLDFKVEIMQKSLRVTELNLAHYNFLPAVVANSGFASRNNYLSTGDLDLTSGITHAPRTTSQEQRTQSSDITFSWNVLDFGLSYIRAQQSADKVLIAEEAKRKVIQRIIEDTRTAYWRAVSSDRMVRKLAALETRTKTALANSHKLLKSEAESPTAALTYQRELIEIVRASQKLQRELSVAKTQLAALMNLEPGSNFDLAGDAINAAPPSLAVDAEDMLQAALLNRAELRDVQYQRRINDREARAALLELLPGIQLYAGSNYDSNKYLDNNQWLNWGAKASWNAMRVFQYPAKDEVINAQDKLLDARALALTMAVMTQVHVSRIRYLNTSKELRTARDYYDVQSRLLTQMRKEMAAEKISEQTLIREELNTLVAEAQRDIAFSGVQNAYANVFASVGLDPYSNRFDMAMSVADLSAELKGLWIERGDFGGHRKITLASYQVPAGASGWTAGH